MTMFENLGLIRKGERSSTRAFTCALDIQGEWNIKYPNSLPWLVCKVNC